MNKMTLTTLVAAGALAFSCNDKALLDPIFAYPAYAIIDGDTIKTRDDKEIKDKYNGHPQHHLTVTTGDTIMVYKSPKKNKPAKVPNLNNIANPDRKGKKFRMVVFGGSVAAGVRDGGLFNEGIETSYGSLIANQMGIDFKNPLFDEMNYNGYGRKVPTTFNPTAGPLPKFKNVTNNTAIEPNKKSESGKTVLKKVTTDYDNYAFPFSSYIPLAESKGYVNNSYELPTYVNRMGNVNYAAELKAGKTFDFFIMEVPDEDIGQALPYDDKEYEFHMASPEFDFLNYPLPYLSKKTYYANFFKKVKRIKSKGVILNSPNLQETPFYKQNYKEGLMKITNTYNIDNLHFYGISSGLKQKSEVDFGNVLNHQIYFGDSSLDSLLSFKVNINLKPGISKKRPVGLAISDYKDLDVNNQFHQNANNDLTYIAKKLGYPVVDLFSLYQSVSKGTYVTVDGVKVSGDWFRGNFYSADGIHPSAFGQAVISNEIIKVMNSYYKLDIPYINTHDYLK